MSTKKAYYYLFNRLTDLILLLQDPEINEAINIPLLLKEAQLESENIVIKTSKKKTCT